MNVVNVLPECNVQKKKRSFRLTHIFNVWYMISLILSVYRRWFQCRLLIMFSYYMCFRWFSYQPPWCLATFRHPLKAGSMFSVSGFGIVFSEEAYTILEEMNVTETNITRVGLVPGETSSTALDGVGSFIRKVMIFQFNIWFLFDTDINQMNSDAWLRNYDSPGGCWVESTKVYHQHVCIDHVSC